MIRQTILLAAWATTLCGTTLAAETNSNRIRSYEKNRSYWQYQGQPVLLYRQRQGIGRGLIQAGLRQLADSGVDLVFVLGYPDYYSRLGFKPAGFQGLQATYPIPPQNADAWMVTELTPGTVENCKGTVRCSNALEHPKYWIE